jgi:hypothetical protein
MTVPSILATLSRQASKEFRMLGILLVSLVGTVLLSFAVGRELLAHIFNVPGIMLTDWAFLCFGALLGWILTQITYYRGRRGNSLADPSSWHSFLSWRVLLIIIGVAATATFGFYPTALEPKSFSSQGPPVLESVEPSCGVIGDPFVIRLRGHNLSDANQILFGRLTGTIVSISSTEIAVRAPENGLTLGETAIVVKTSLGQSADPMPYRFISVVTRVNPNEALEGQLVSIEGRGFNPRPNANIVKFGDQSAVVEAVGSNGLLVRVPSGSGSVWVTANGPPCSGPLARFTYMAIPSPVG